MDEPDIVDALDRRILHALEVDGRAPFSRIAQVLGVSDQTIARRYRRLRAECGLRVVLQRDPLVLGHDLWMLRLRCTPEGAAAIATALARRPDTAWVALASGGTEVVCMASAPRRGDRELLLGKLPRTPSIVEIRAQQVLHRFHGGPSGWPQRPDGLTHEQALAIRSPLLPDLDAALPSGAVQLTAEDQSVVTALEADGRATTPELARATGLSESVIKRRLAALFGSGAVYTDADFAPELFGGRVSALLWITAAPPVLARVGAQLSIHPEVVFAAATGGPSNLVAGVVVTDVAALYTYLSGPLGSLDGVVHIDATLFLSRVKQLTYQPLRRAAAPA
ncbi:putative AsnC family transcriptional regulator [Nocardia brasiliensis NBRC 14402]|uniref:Lrp/AsnC family transcriptional regulator n=1 Tax=Nocardia brasiliensis TaxID=37326 RepID=UPI0003176E09|nr:AsnC family transcriptional regulator [Nocardia brasiliensis]ASF09471.1 AsnC family protein [Nocardia brasiliensis]GAJ86589.1 putative AsnC family transcriptional regulator [Nocardia brasiliensis NBRC 14402]SUB39818.1 DNA-binding transcriptional regulator AsnC [Nocardia brasiliensis]